MANSNTHNPNQNEENMDNNNGFHEEQDLSGSAEVPQDAKSDLNEESNPSPEDENDYIDFHDITDDESTSYSTPKSRETTNRYKRTDRSKIAQAQVVRLRKETKLKRLKQEHKELKNTLQRGYLLYAGKPVMMERDGRRVEKIVKKQRPLDSATRAMLLERSVMYESEIFELSEDLKNRKTDIRKKSINNTRASRISLSKRKKEVKKIKTVNRYKNLIKAAGATGAKADLLQAISFSNNGKDIQAIEKIQLVLKQVRAQQNPGVKSELEFDEEIGKELLNFLIKSYSR